MRGFWLGYGTCCATPGSAIAAIFEMASLVCPCRQQKAAPAASTQSRLLPGTKKPAGSLLPIKNFSAKQTILIPALRKAMRFLAQIRARGHAGAQLIPDRRGTRGVPCLFQIFLGLNFKACLPEQGGEHAVSGPCPTAECAVVYFANAAGWRTCLQNGFAAAAGQG